MLRLYHPFFHLILGLVLLFMGRSLFWILVGAVGFLSGFELAEYFFVDQPFWVMVATGVCLGLVGLIMALIFQHIAIILTGILAGGLIGLELYLLLFPLAGDLRWMAFILGAFLGGILVEMFFSWMLIILSAIFGAMLLLEPFYTGPIFNHPIFWVLFITGMIIQSCQLEAKASKS
jgi:hypothetical protein